MVYYFFNLITCSMANPTIRQVFSFRQWGILVFRSWAKIEQLLWLHHRKCFCGLLGIFSNRYCKEQNPSSVEDTILSLISSTSHRTGEVFTKLRHETSHSPYSSDLTPCDLYLPPNFQAFSMAQTLFNCLIESFGVNTGLIPKGSTVKSILKLVFPTCSQLWNNAWKQVILVIILFVSY